LAFKMNLESATNLMGFLTEIDDEEAQEIRKKGNGSELVYIEAWNDESDDECSRRPVRVRIFKAQKAAQPPTAKRSTPPQKPTRDRSKDKDAIHLRGPVCDLESPKENCEPEDLDPARTFTCFPQLPTELRLKIWKTALPGSRVVRIDFDNNINRNFNSGDNRHGYCHSNRITVPIRNPVLLSVSCEARQVALEQYQPVFHAHATSKQETTYFDYENDVLYFNASILLNGMNFFQTIFDSQARRKFKNIAFPLTDFNVVMPRLSMFPRRSKLFMMVNGFGNEFQGQEDQLYLGEIELHAPLDAAMEMEMGKGNASSKGITSVANEAVKTDVREMKDQAMQLVAVSDLQDQELSFFRCSFEYKKKVFPKWPAPELVFASLENTGARTPSGLVRWY